MKALLTLALCALPLDIHASDLPKDTVDLYVIDNVAITGFDGTQLAGKVIDKYVITYADKGKTVEKKHCITTKTTGKTPAGKMVTIKGQGEAEGKDTDSMLVLLDGKEIKWPQFSGLKSEDIKNVTILKAGSKAAKAVCKQRGHSAKGSVMIVTSASNAKAPEKVVYINAKKSSESEMNKLQANRIASMTVKTTDGVTEVYIVTK